MTEAVANGSLAQTAGLRQVARLAALAALFAAFLATSGALDTEAASHLPRLAYWLFVALLSTAALEGAQRLAARHAPGAAPSRLRFLGLALLVLPLTAVATLSCKLLFGGQPSIGGFAHLLPGMTGILAGLQLVLALFAPASPPAAAAEPAAARPGAPFCEALPLPLRRAAIEAVEAEDHYVRVHTDAGAALIRMRFGDAVTALADREGLRPHRSWWVAADAVVALGRTEIRLRSGTAVPVSRGARRGLGPDFRRDASQASPRC